MSTYRQIRRQTRRARRAGLQPIVVIDSGLPVPVGAAPRPARVAVPLRDRARHHGGRGPRGRLVAPPRPRRTVAIAARRLRPGRVRARRTRRADRAVPARRTGLRGCCRARGGRVARGRRSARPVRLADAASPRRSARSCSLSPGGRTGAAGPGHECSARFAAWPDISKSIGLPGSKIQSASVDLWGWRARLRLARGQTIADVTARIPAIESALGTYRGAVRVHPTGDGKANRCELRILDTDPHAEAVPWPGPSARSITQPVDLGPFEDAEQCRVSFLRRHALFAGTTGSGKSGGLNVLMATLAACDDVVIWAIDLKNGMELSPWAPCIDRLATTADQAAALLADAVAILQARAGHLAATGQRVWEPSPDMPALLIIVDEYAELADEAPAAMSDTDAIARLGRAVAVTLIAATQRPTQKAMGQGAVRSQMDTRICFRVRERKDVDLVLGQGMLGAGWHAHTLNAPGKFLVSAPEHTTPKRARAYLVTDDDVARTTARYGWDRPQLDSISRGALHHSPAPAEPVPWYLVNAQHDAGEPEDTPDAYEPATQEDALWGALCDAPDEGADIAELMRASGMTRPTLYRHLPAHADAGRAVQVSRGRWRAARTGDGGER